jgi:hypothetical protein
VPLAARRRECRGKPNVPNMLLPAQRSRSAGERAELPVLARCRGFLVPFTRVIE